MKFLDSSNTHDRLLDSIDSFRGEATRRDVRNGKHEFITFHVGGGAVINRQFHSDPWEENWKGEIYLKTVITSCKPLKVIVSTKLLVVPQFLTRCSNETLRLSSPLQLTESETYLEVCVKTTTRV